MEERALLVVCTAAACFAASFLHLDVPLDGGKMQRGPLLIKDVLRCYTPDPAASSKGALLLRCALSDICFGIEQCRAALG